MQFSIRNIILQAQGVGPSSERHPSPRQASLSIAEADARRWELAAKEQTRAGRDAMRLAARREKELRSAEADRRALEMQVLDLQVGLHFV